MKKLTLFACMIGLLAAGVSCKDDDDKGGSATPTDGFAYDGKVHKPSYGMAIEYGSDGTHFNTDFIMFDGEVDMATETLEDNTFELYAELFSNGTASFKTGTFTYLDPSSTSVAGKNYFEWVEFGHDANADGDISESEYQTATAGKVIVSGTNPNYSIEFDVTLQNGKNLKGKYTAAFVVLDDSEWRSAPGSDLRTTDKKRRFRN